MHFTEAQKKAGVSSTDLTNALDYFRYSPKAAKYRVWEVLEIKNTVKYEHRAYYDNLGTGNYTEDKSERFDQIITAEKAKQFVDLLLAIGCKHYETSKAHFYETATDTRHFTQYIIYK